MHKNRALPVPSRTLVATLVAATAAAAVWAFASNGSSTPWHSGSAAPVSQLRVDGNVELTSENNVVTKLVVPLEVDGNDGILLTEGHRLHASTAMSASASAAVPATYSVNWLDGNGDEILDPGEHVTVMVLLPAESSVHPGNPIDLIIRPIDGTSLTVKVQ